MGVCNSRQNNMISQHSARHKFQLQHYPQQRKVIILTTVKGIPQK